MKILQTSIAALVLSVFASTASASAILSFDDDNDPSTQNGTLAYDGAGGALIGSGIDFVSVFASGTGNDGIYTCVGCELNFATGANTSEGPFAWTFGGGGSITVTGTVMDGATVVATGTLLSGYFSGAITIGTGFDLTDLSMSGLGTDTKNPDLLDYLGLSDTPFRFASTNISAGNVIYDGTGGFSAIVTNADLDNTAPEPAISALIGLGLLGLGLARRRA